MSDDDQKQAAAATTETKVRMRFDATTAAFASEFVVNATADHLLVNLSSGYINDPVSGQTVLPIHDRIALSPTGARRLVALLTHALETSASPNADLGKRAAEAAFPAIATQSKAPN